MKYRPGLSHLGMCMLVLALLLQIPLARSEVASLNVGEVVDITHNGQLYLADKNSFPATLDELPFWLSQQQAVTSVNLLGGSYWFYVELQNNTDHTQWIINPDGTLIENVEVRLYSDDGSVQHFVTGYRAEHDYMLHYGKEIFLLPASTATLLLRFESPYYASTPNFELLQETDYRQRVGWENVLVLAAFGALLTLALYNTFIFAITLERTFIYYASYLIAYFLGWAFTFHVPAELLGWKNLHLHYIPFFLLPVLNTLFYMEFLQLKTHFPRLAAISRINYILPLILLPSCFLALSYAHMLATLVISFWLIIALVCGIASMRSGFRPARYFVLAFVALLIPGTIILPANIGLIPDLVRNAELLTLLGGTLDAILLAFALADKIRMLSDEKDRALRRSNKMLEVARTDHLTGISNRHAFDQDLETMFQLRNEEGSPSELMLLLIDLDGMKRINDRFGHARGDELLCSFARDLAQLQISDITVYRLGGDEFTILARRSHDQELRHAMDRLENQLHANGFADVGISYGVAFASEVESADDLLTRADLRMYNSKTARRLARADDGRFSSPQLEST